MQNAGKNFEEQFKKSVPSDMYYFRIKDPPQSFNQNINSGLRFSPKNPFDSFIYSYPNLFVFELKSTKGTSFSFERFKNDGTSKMIKHHQINGLKEASEIYGIIAGIVFNFREVGKSKNNKLYFLPIHSFSEFMNDTDKKSINMKDIIKYGGIEIIGVLKRVKYNYQIGEFIKKQKQDFSQHKNGQKK
jgi:penicillin-binding protein-related factor A (putative recombinase)